jgi:hypothetical protein
MVLSLSIVFGYSCRYLCPRLCPGACIYLSHEDTCRSFYNMNMDEMDDFIEKKNPYNIRHIYYNLRVPSMDASNNIINRFAYTTISLEFKKISAVLPKELWRTLCENRKALQFMKECGQISNETIDYVEKKLWASLDPYSKRRILKMVNTMVKHICMNHAEKIWNPDYVWKTSPNVGKKTSQILIERAGLN